MRSRSTVLGLLLLTLPAIAQEDILRPRGAPAFAPVRERPLPIMLGIEGGVNWNTASQSLQYQPTPAPTNTPPQLFKSGNGLSPAVRILADIGLTPNLGLRLHVGYDVKTVGHSGTAEADCQNLYDPTIITTVPVSVDWTFTTNYLTAGAGIRYNVSAQLWLTAGIVAHFHRSNRQKTKYSVPETSNCGFLNPEDNRLYRQLEVELEINSPPMKSSRIGAELGAGYAIPLNPKLWLVPRLQLQLLSSFREDMESSDGWKWFSEGLYNVRLRNASQHSIQLLLGLWFDL